MPARKFPTMMVVVVVFGAAIAARPDSKPFELTLIHTNDTHANHEPQESGDGGSGRSAAVIKQIRALVPNSLVLDAGDRFTGTLFHRKYRGRDNVEVMNRTGFHAMTLGNHEFDEGDRTLAEFVAGVNFPVLCANVDFTRSPDLNGKINPFTVLTVGGEQIGVIGLVTADAAANSSPGKKLVFDADYASCTQKAVDDLTARGVNKIVVLSHVGLPGDLKLAETVSGVDVIVGGHSHLLLSKTYKEAVDTYPVKRLSKTKEPVYVVHAGGGDNRFVGRLDLTFDTAGFVTEASGDTVLLSQYISPDPDVQKEIDRLAGPISELKKTAIPAKSGGPVEAAEDIPAANVREQENGLANLFADALRLRGETQVAFIGSGSIRSGINRGRITFGDLYRVFPFDNTLCVVRYRGATLRATLEHGMSRYKDASGTGRFLQVSGLRYTADPRRKIGSRIVSVEVAEADGRFVPLDETATYTVAVDSYIRGGGDGFEMLKTDAISATDFIVPLADVYIEYLASHSPIRPRLEGRITIK